MARNFNPMLPAHAQFGGIVPRACNLEKLFRTRTKCKAICGARFCARAPGEIFARARNEKISRRAILSIKIGVNHD